MPIADTSAAQHARMVPQCDQAKASLSSWASSPFRQHTRTCTVAMYLSHNCRITVASYKNSTYSHIYTDIYSWVVVAGCFLGHPDDGRWLFNIVGLT